MTTQQIIQTINHDFKWTGQHYPVLEGRPASTAITPLAWKDISTATGPRTFDVTNRDGKTHRITVDQHTLHVLDCLTRRPIESACVPAVREYVRRLKHDHGVEIHCQRYEGNKYGCYHLIAEVERVKAEVQE